jgi:DNA-binding beta-propeller fold protein YncE
MLHSSTKRQLSLIYALSLSATGLLGVSAARAESLYVATNTGYPNYSGNFTVIDTETKKVMKIIPSGRVYETLTFGTAMVVTPDGKALYFISGETAANSTVSALNTETYKVSKPIAVKRLAGSLAVSPDGEFTIIDVRSGKVLAIPNVALGAQLVIAPDGKRAYVLDFPSHRTSFT